MDKAQLNSFSPNITPYVDAINSACEKYGIKSLLERQHFLAQIAHETGEFKTFVENLNYSAEGLARVWPKRYAEKDGTPNSLALRLHRKPADIANNVYADRMGNGPESSGDGWKYRGRGAIQITGKDNYTAYSKATYGDLRILDTPDVLATTDAILSAAWYWSTHKCSTAALKDDVTAVTKLINGGTVGLPHRKELLAKAKKLITVA